jgi:predicted small secreted protein
MNTSARRFASFLILACLTLSLTTACNTMRGLGKDTTVVGEKIEEEADRHIDDDEKRDPSSAPAALPR